MFKVGNARINPDYVIAIRIASPRMVLVQLIPNTHGDVSVNVPENGSAESVAEELEYEWKVATIYMAHIRRPEAMDEDE